MEGAKSAMALDYCRVPPRSATHETQRPHLSFV
jgi:hypothetical protein